MSQSAANGVYREPYRPQFHFSPPANWINDPNGLVWHGGRYHLFYQYNPNGDVWGDIHWAHASSTDLVHWRHEPLALFPDPELGMPFSGCAVVDWQNTSGLQSGVEPPLIAVFTHGGETPQAQSIASSNDGGQSWQLYAGNPVIPNPGIKDFRDPKVFWHEPSQHWIMVLAVGDHIQLYRSANLSEWQWLQDIGKGQWPGFGEWEMPDLFPLRLPEGTECWVLLVGVGNHTPNRGSGTFYVLGAFDGLQFRPEPGSEPLWCEYGPDNYALQTWSDTPEQRRTGIAWMSNWRYAKTIPTSPWRGNMTLPRELRLEQTPVGIRLANLPVPELDALITDQEVLPAVAVSESVCLSSAVPELCRLELDLGWEQGAAPQQLHVALRSDAGDSLTIDYQPALALLEVVRQSGAGLALPEGFADPLLAQLPYGPDGLQLLLVLDCGTAELFVANGLVSLSLLQFPAQRLRHLWLSVEGGAVNLVRGEIAALRATVNEAAHRPHSVI